MFTHARRGLAAVLIMSGMVMTCALATDHESAITGNLQVQGAPHLPGASRLYAATSSPGIPMSNPQVVPTNIIGDASNDWAAPAAPTPANWFPAQAFSGVSCSGGDDTAALNAALELGSWSLPAKKTCRVSGPLSLSASARLSGHQWSTAISPNAALTSLIDIAGAESNRASVEGLYLLNVSSQATSGLRYHNSAGNNPINVKNNRLFGFANGVLSDGAWPGGDLLNIERSFFQNNGVHINFDNNGMNSSVHGNVMLNGSGIRFSKWSSGGNQNEGTRVYDNTILPHTAAGSYGMSITAGYELSIFANIFDQIRHNHGVIMDATESHSVANIKLISNWIGIGQGIDPNLDGLHIAGPANYIPIIANTVGNWTNYGVNFIAGMQDSPIIANKFYKNKNGDLYLNDTAGVTLIANRFRSNPAWIEAGMTKTVAIGNRCDSPAVVSGASLVLGDGSCAGNRIPGILTVRQSNTTQVEQLALLNESTANSIAKTDGISFSIKDTGNDVKGAARIRVIPRDPNVTAASMAFYTRHSDAISNTTPDLEIDTSGNVEVGSALMVGSLMPLTLTAGAVGLAKMPASGSAPGAAGGKIELVCGTKPGTAKLQAYAGTSSAPVTILDNIGAGVTGC